MSATVIVSETLPNVDTLVTIVILGLACGAASTTVARTDMFKGFRKAFARWEWSLKLVTCYYCLGHWFALGAVLVVNPWPTWAGFVMSWLAVTAVSGIAATRVLE
jgi:hypothetical protein